MSKWERPDPWLVKVSEPISTGRDLGVINKRYFEPATWETLLTCEMGRGQYGKFVALMMERIRTKESTYDETRSFVNLVATEHNWDFMKVAVPYLPELKEQYPADINNVHIASLLSHLKPIKRRRSLEKVQKAYPKATPASNLYENGLNESEEQLLRRNMFGPDRGAVDSPEMNRLFKSTMELGFPQPALDKAVREAKERGTDIERDCEGLPTSLRMPSPVMLTPTSSASSRTVPVSPAIEAKGDNQTAQIVFLPALDLSGLHTPGLIIPDESSTSQAELPMLDSKDIETLHTLDAESRNRHRAPPVEPPDMQRGSAEYEEFKSLYQEPDDVFLKYFQSPVQKPGAQKSRDIPEPPSPCDPVFIAAAPESDADGHECDDDDGGELEYEL